MSWMTANDYFALEIAARDHVNDLAAAAVVVDDVPEHTEPCVSRRGNGDLERVLIHVWRPCISEGRQAA